MKTELVIATAREILNDLFNEFPKEMKGHDGGVLCLKRIGENPAFHSVPIQQGVSSISKESFEFFRRRTRSKIHRLLRMNESHGHISSWHNPRWKHGKRKKRCGAIMFDDWVFSFDGLATGELDELLIVRVALKMGLITKPYAEKIFSISSNQYSV